MLLLSSDLGSNEKFKSKKELLVKDNVWVKNIKEKSQKDLVLSANKSKLWPKTLIPALCSWLNLEA